MPLTARARHTRTRDVMPEAKTSDPSARDAAVDLECDDEFEEFARESWDDAEGAGRGKHAADREEGQWEEDWDDADARDDFSKQLRAELEKRA